MWCGLVGEGVFLEKGMRKDGQDNFEKEFSSGALNQKMLKCIMKP